MSFYDKHKDTLANALRAVHERAFYAAYAEHPKVYGETAPDEGEARIKALMGNRFALPGQPSDKYVGGEDSPYTQQPLGVTYPQQPVDQLVAQGHDALKQWRKVSPMERAGVLIETLEAIKAKFFDIAYATMHTTGQSYIMSFQASGPHAADRALESIALGYQETTRFPQVVMWEKPMGKFTIKMEKHYTPMPKGVGLVIGCSTFPVWNTLPGVFADLATGNTVIIKPHPKAILPIAICVAAMQQVFIDNGYNPCIVQLAADELSHPITKQLAEHEAIKLIDYTGGTAFGNYIEGLKGKTVFTEKAGVNSVMLHSMADLKAVADNLAFSVALYSGQMCTAPQNIFIPQDGVKVGDQMVSYDDTVKALKDAMTGLVTNPKMGPGTVGAIQNEATVSRVKEANAHAYAILHTVDIKNEEFPEARVTAPVILEVNAEDAHAYDKELFGPIAVIIKTKDIEQSIQLTKDLIEKHGAITCAAYTTDDKVMEEIRENMHDVFAPVSFNLTGFIWVNQHAAFSDFHVTGGNPAGNATFTNPEFIVKRFVWVGDRKLVS